MHKAATYIVAIFLAGILPSFAADTSTDTQLDAFWAEVSRTVAEGDFAGYAATYHSDAVLVSQSRGGVSVPIAKALDGWQQGFLDTQAGKTTANVKFRFTDRLNDETTAHETGIFHYTADSADGEGADQYVHFEALLVRKGDWKMLMEYQKEPATEAEWNAAL
jgi:ketosteroid isomerase-like protein